jgi:hypothetical protein
MIIGLWLAANRCSALTARFRLLRTDDSFGAFRAFSMLFLKCFLASLIAAQAQTASTVTHDKFFIVIETDDPKYSETETRKLLETTGSKHIEMVEE